MLALLVAAAFVAGLVDAIAGGGGLMTVPLLFASGLDARAVLATNKAQAVFGSCASMVGFARHGELDRDRAPWSFVFAAAGSAVGVSLVLVLDPKVLRPIVLGLLVVASLTALLRRDGRAEGVALVKRHPLPFAAAVALALGAYDGFFGPGTGTFLLLLYAHLFGDALVRASGNAKVANFGSNLVSFVLFALSGAVVWRAALPMGVAQLAGSLIGTKLAVRGGARVVRGLVALISLLLAVRLALQLFPGLL